MHSHQYLHSNQHQMAPRDLPVIDLPLAPRAEHSAATENEVSSIPANTSLYTHGLTGVNQGQNYLFVNLLLTLVFIICAASLCLRLWKVGNNHLRHLFATGAGRDKQMYWTRNQTAWWPWTKRYLLYAPLWKKRHNREIQLSSAVSLGTLPSRYHFLVLFAYFVCNVAYCSVLDYTKNHAAVLAELRGRSGALATYNIIPTILFALRNNPFIPLLKVSFDTFNLLHRWIARIVIAEAIVHVFAWGALEYHTKGWKGTQEAIGHSDFLQTGTVGFVLFVFILIQAWAPIRHAFYETFLNIHRLSALAAIIGVYKHMETGRLPQLPWGKLILALWALEVLFRLVRILYYNVTRQAVTKITVEALPSEACRVTFHLARPWRFTPGSHVHAYFLRHSLWASHPFSVAWADDHPINNIAEKLPSTTHDTDLDRAGDVRTSLSIITRARTGMTRSLYNAACKTPNRVLQTWGAIEGPYGGHESLDSYGTLLLFAGGVGITHQISYIRHLVSGAHAGTVAARKIILVWSVPNTEALEWVRPWMDEILKMPGRREVLKIMLFVTKPKSMQEVISGTGTVQMFPGRCNPQTVLDKEFVERVGAMVVTVCGPGGFADSVRLAARRRVQVGKLDFVEEAFTY